MGVSPSAERQRTAGVVWSFNMSKSTPPIPDIKGRGISGFYRDVMREMKHVNWPTRQESTRLTGVVLGVCGLLALVLTGLSFGLEVLLRMVGIGAN